MRLQELIPGGGNEEITFLTLDSRKCAPGALYFAITGTRVDGHSFLSMAYEKGAAAAIVEHRTDCPIPQYVVQDTRAAMARIAAEFYHCPAEKLTMLGVTGTNGKTSVSYMLAAIAKAAGVPCGVIGTSGIRIGEKKLEIPIATSTTPDPIELQAALAALVKEGARWCAMEVTAHALDLRKVDGMRFASGGFTNLTEDHLDYFLEMESYFRAKEKLFPLCAGSVLNADDTYGRRLKESFPEAWTYSVSGDADLAARNIVIHPSASEFSLCFRGREYPVRMHTTGLFNISNALCAVGCAMQAGTDIQTAIRGIESFRSVPGRFEAVDTGESGISVIVDYAHTPDGLENILRAINSFKKGRLICVFGCGGNRDALKRPIMGQLAGEWSDFCVLTSDNPRMEKPEEIIDAIEAGIRKTACPYLRNADRRAAIRLALAEAGPGDVVAICGKGDEDYQDILGEKHHFSDREVVEELVKEWGK